MTGILKLKTSSYHFTYKATRSGVAFNFIYMYGYLGKGKHSKQELEEILGSCMQYVDHLESRIDNLQNSHTGNFG